MHHGWVSSVPADVAKILEGINPTAVLIGPIDAGWRNFRRVQPPSQPGLRMVSRQDAKQALSLLLLFALGLCTGHKGTAREDRQCCKPICDRPPVDFKLLVLLEVEAGWGGLGVHLEESSEKRAGWALLPTDCIGTSGRRGRWASTPTLRQCRDSNRIRAATARPTIDRPFRLGPSSMTARSTRLNRRLR